MKTTHLILLLTAAAPLVGQTQQPAPIYTPSQRPIGAESSAETPSRTSPLGGILRAITGEQDSSNISLDQLTRNWTPEARAAAEKMFRQYGSPQEISTDRLVWRNNGPWRSTQVINQQVEHNFPTPHRDVLEQSIALAVPPEKVSELAQFSGSILVDRTKGEIAARCDTEENNYIALNLAHDIITGRLSAEQARARFTDLAQGVQQGRQASYATGIQFNATASNTAFADGPGAQSGQQSWQRIGW